MSVTSDDWEPCIAGYMQERNGHIVVVPEVNHDVIPLFCPICDFPMRTSDDASIFEKAGCCETCYLRWGEARPQEWLAGWRPSDEELQTYIEIRRRTPPRLSSR